MPEQTLRRDVDAFLTRLSTLSESAWEDILARSRLGAGAWVRAFGRGVRDVLTRPFRQRQAPPSPFVFSDAAVSRVFALAKVHAIPDSPRVLGLVSWTVIAICSRGALTPQQLSRSYAPFEPFIPFASLPEPEDAGKRAGGA